MQSMHDVCNVRETLVFPLRSRPMNWSLPADLAGTRVVLTGATGGLGFHVAAGLARRGADVLMTARDAARGADLVRRLSAVAPPERLDVVEADLADLGSLERAAATVRERTPSVDVLINNAGIMLAPNVPTADGLPLQMGTNHL